MTFKFAWLVELLQDLDGTRTQKALPASLVSNPDHTIVTCWFKRYGHKISRQGKSGAAFLACIFPERCPQRSYNLQEKRLSSVFGRALGLGSSRVKRLNSWREKNGADFASCVESIMAECEFDPPGREREVTLEEINTALIQLAANSPFSSPELRAHANDERIDDILRPILLRLRSFQAKWFARLLLKSFAPVQIPEQLTMCHFHFLLPDLFSIQNSISGVVSMLSKPSVCGIPPNPQKEYVDALKILVVRDLEPQLGVMIKRQPYIKARSIRHCSQLAGQRVMSVERKYDGEYCQIHVDMSKHDCIQIFSKSGKDSTQDRIRLHGAVLESLQIGTSACRIKQKCILEGELLVWNTRNGQIEPFYKIRRHVMHGGRYLGISGDSPKAADEHLMIVFYDILLLDDQILMNESLDKRRQQLTELVVCIAGFADICECEIINFGSRHGPERLRSQFAKCILRGWEGLMLKGFDDPYFSWKHNMKGIKLKKDYISGLGESADLCIVGGRRDMKVEQELNLGRLSWTTFYLACVENRDVVRRFNEKAQFYIVDTLGHHCISKDDILYLNEQGRFIQVPFPSSQSHLDVKIGNGGLRRPTELFKTPFVVEVYGAGFDRPSNCSFFTLRFPRTKSVKLHSDRDILDTMTFDELQEMAMQSIATSSNPDSQQDEIWMKRLIQADGRIADIITLPQSTTPIRASRSATMISISPTSARRLATPVFIRSDTNDMGMSADKSPEHQEQKIRAGVTSLTSNAGFKRKSSSDETSPRANLTKKRIKLAICKDRTPDLTNCPLKDPRGRRAAKVVAIHGTLSTRMDPSIAQQSYSSSSIFSPSPSHTEGVTRPQIRLLDQDVTVLHPRRTTSASNGSSSPRAPTTTSPEAREPLIELPNFSPLMSRRSLASVTRISSDQEVNDTPKSDQHGQQSGIQDVVTKSTTSPTSTKPGRQSVLPRAATYPAGLLVPNYQEITPRRNTLECSKSDTSTTPTSQIKKRSTKATAICQRSTPGMLNSSAIENSFCTSSFLLGSSVHTLTTNRFRKKQAFQDSEANVTTSAACFLDHILDQHIYCPHHHIVLIDTAAPSAAANDILDLGKAVLRRIRNASQHYTRRHLPSPLSASSPLTMRPIVFVDCHILLHNQAPQSRPDSIRPQRVLTTAATDKGNSMIPSPNLSISATAAEKHFCAALQFGADTVNEPGRNTAATAKVTWEWEEVFSVRS